ncbi:hypothetical protein SAMN05192575_101828 [Nocardioides alpinus]|uniref:Uncharacterized protein n=1 Tax=Nocardioides alpinus TaxID=748909 RepID=A0A1I0WAZ3_9ACTN|nr:hypothetical protein [Nocardioides alpinus]PKH37785.1 hypothetical protein CXG46_20495 [Nocardioides alpinus]SFA85380.1 hypothetical protein SAMN05192575_101828 [Nocardioides alpinus]
MSTDIDWQRELDSSFSTGEDLPPAHYVASGRRAVRRRRAAAVVLAASIALAGTAAWAASPGSSPRGDAPVATERTGASEPEGADQGRQTRRDRLRSLAELRRAGAGRVDFLGGPAALADGGLVLAPGAGPVLERVPNPMGYTKTQGSSLAIRVMFEGREQYSLMAAFPSSTSTMTNDASGDFEGWLAGVVASQRTLDVANGVTRQSGEPGPDEWLTIGPDGQVRAATDRVEVLEVRDGVDLGDSFAAGTDRAGVVRLQVDGDPVCAAYRLTDGTLEVIPGGGRFSSLDAFVTWARAQYASGQGMR